MNIRIYFLIVLFITSCTQTPKNSTVKGNIKGFQKGTLYLQKVNDGGFTTLDSLPMNSTTDFELGYDLEEAEMLFLSISKNMDAERISFFADKSYNYTYKFETLQVRCSNRRQYPTRITGILL